MADNKQKPNFADALKAQAKPVADPKETVEVETSPGVFKKVVRGSMSDAAWERTKQRAVVRVQPTSVEYDTPADVNDLESREETGRSSSPSERAAAAREKRRKSLVELVHNEHYQPGQDGLVPDKQTLEHLRKMPESDAADYLEARVKHQEWKQEEDAYRAKKLSDDNSPESDGAGSSGMTRKLQPIEMDTSETISGARKPSQGSPDEWKQKPQGGNPGRGLQQEFDGAMGMSIDPRNPASAIPQMAMGAVGEGKSPSGDPAADTHFARADAAGNATGEADASALRDLSDNVGQTTRDMALTVPRIGAKVVDSVVGGSPLLSPEVKQDLGGIPNLIQNSAASATQQMALPAAGVASALGMPGIANKMADVANNVQYAPSEGGAGGPSQSVDPGMAQPAAQPVNDRAFDPSGAGGSLSMSERIPGAGFKVEQVDPGLQKQYDAARLAHKTNIENAQDTIAAGEIVKDGLVRAASERERTAQVDAAKFSQLAAQARLDSIEEAKGYNTRKLALAQQAREAAQNPIDPNRFWNNKSDGQKAAAVIAGALFGFTGQGMQWLQRLDGLVENDNKLQAQDRASRVQGLQQEADVMGEAGRQAIAQGASRAEAYLLDKNTKLEGLKSYLDTVAMKTTNMDAKMRGAQMSAELSQRIVANDQEALSLAQQRADKKTEWNYRNAELGMKAYAISAKANGTGKSGLKFSPGEVAKMDAARQGFDAVDTLKSMLGPEQGLGSALKDEVMKHGGQLTEAGRRQKGVEPQRRALIRLIDDSVINKADAEYWKDKISNVGLDNMSQSDLDGLKRFFISQHNAIVKTRQSIGSSMEDTQPPAYASPE